MGAKLGLSIRKISSGLKTEDRDFVYICNDAASATEVTSGSNEIIADARVWKVRLERLRKTTESHDNT
jgi:hypothetical protein